MGESGHFFVSALTYAVILLSSCFDYCSTLGNEKGRMISDNRNYATTNQKYEEKKKHAVRNSCQGVLALFFNVVT